MTINFTRILKEFESSSIPISTLDNKSDIDWFYNLKSLLLRFLPKQYREEYKAEDLLNWYSKNFFKDKPEGTILRKVIYSNNKQRYEIGFYLYNTHITAWRYENDTDWKFDIGKAKGMIGGQVVNYLKKMLPHPNDKSLRPGFDKTRPYNEKDLMDKEAEAHRIGAENREREFRQKYVKTNLADFEKTLAVHNWYWMRQNGRDFQVGKKNSDMIQKMLAYFKDHTDEYEDAINLYDRYRNK